MAGSPAGEFSPGQEMRRTHPPLLPLWVGSCSLARLWAREDALGLRRPQGALRLEREKEEERERRASKNRVDKFIKIDLSLSPN